MPEAGTERKAKDHQAEAFNARIEALLVFYAADVVCYPAPGWTEGDAACHGHDGFRKLAGVWTENVDDAALEIHEVRDMGERVLILAEFTGRTKDSDVSSRRPFGVVNSDLRNDGKVGRVEFFLTWRQAREAAGKTGS